jgi:hypothetical protein
MTGAERLDAARRLLDRPDASTAGLWPRAAALLARQALECLLDDFWRAVAPRVCDTNARARLLCLRGYDSVRDAAPRVSVAWAGLSRGCHHHPYELPPTRDELEGWMRVVEQFGDTVVQAVAEEVRRPPPAPGGARK